MQFLVDYLSSRELVAAATAGTILTIVWKCLTICWRYMPRLLETGGILSSRWRSAVREYERRSILRAAAVARRMMNAPNGVAKSISVFIEMMKQNAYLLLSGIGWPLMTYVTVEAIGPTPILDEVGYILGTVSFFLGILFTGKAIGTLHTNLRWLADPAKERREALDAIAT